MRQILSVVLVIVIASSQLFTQTNQALLVPFNDHGTWGYCDTLGSIQIEPAYNTAYFFYSRKFAEGPRNVAQVKTKWGENIIQTNGELLFPRKVNHIREIHSENFPHSLFLIQKKGKYGIYRLNEGMIIKAKYDSLETINHDLLLKRKNGATYMRFNAKTATLDATDIATISTYWHKDMHQQYYPARVFTTLDGRAYELLNGELVLIDLADYTKDGRLVEEAIAFEEGGWDQEIIPDEFITDYQPDPGNLGVDQIITFNDYNRFSFAAKYGIQKLIIAKKNDQMGIVNEKGEEVLPFQYDKISFNDDDTQAILEKDGKVGRKLFFTHHPVIEPVYDKLSVFRRLRVTRTWTFVVFEIEINSMIGYVGENGVEYFDFD